MNRRLRFGGLVSAALLALAVGTQCFAQALPGLPGTYEHDSLYCNSVSSGDTLIGGSHLSSFGTIHALVIFIDFPDDTVDMGNSIWPVGLGPSYGGTFIDADTSVNSGQHFNITNYYEQMSFGNLHVVGHPYYKQALHPLSWYAADTADSHHLEIPYWAMRHVLQYIDTAAAYNVNFGLYDRWKENTPYNHTNVPDDTVEMVICAFRRWYAVPNIDNGGFGAQGHEAFGWRSTQPTFAVEGGTKRITDYSGIMCLNMIDYPSCFEVPIHEFGHHLGLPHQYDGGVWSVMGQRNSNVSYCMNSFEREKMGWITINDVTTDATTVMLPDFATTGTAYRLSLPNSTTHFLLENHQGINEYDVVDVTSGGGKGLYILRQTKEMYVNRLEVMNADGRWKWLNIGHAHNPWSPDPNYQIPVFKRDSVQRDTGRTDRQKVDFTDPKHGSDFQYRWLDPRSGDSVIGAPKAGDGKDMWNLDVANMFSPWSNPSSVADGTLDTATSHIGVHVVEINGSNVYATLYTTSPLNGPPSRPWDLRCWGTVDSTDTSHIKIYPRIAWNGNIEPDVTSGGGYEIWKRDEPYTFGYGTWVLLDSVSGTTTMYVDSTIADADTNDGIHSVSYKIRAFDSTNKLSTYSEDRGIYYGHETGGGDPPCCLGGGKMVARRADDAQAGEVTLWPNRPNPFSGQTEIAYSLTRSGRVLVDVFDASGKRVAVLVNEAEQGAGTYRVTLDGSALPAGVYLCRLIANGNAVAEPLTLSR